MKTIIAIVLVTVVGLVLFGVAYNYVITPPTTSSVASTSLANALTLTISGEVTRPGTYVLSSGATMIDLITAAGGTTSNADALAWNADYQCENKGSYYIAPIYDNANTCSLEPIQKANINADDAATLQEVAGFTKSVANAIVTYRISNDFKSIEDMKNVSGIGQATYIATRDKVVLRSQTA